MLKLSVAKYLDMTNDIHACHMTQDMFSQACLQHLIPHSTNHIMPLHDVLYMSRHANSDITDSRCNNVLTQMATCLAIK